MDAELQDRWRAARPPFDGLTIATEEGMPLSLVRAILARVVPFLEARWPTARLYALHDWHAHDGYLTRVMATSWEQLSTALASDDALRRLCSDDTRVYSAIFPDDYGFYVRFGFVDEWDRPPSALGVEWGDFDVTAAPPLIERIQALIQDIDAPYLETRQAKDFFDRTFAG